jgi:hypothetical protein
LLRVAHNDALQLVELVAERGQVVSHYAVKRPGRPVGFNVSGAVANWPTVNAAP